MTNGQGSSYDRAMEEWRQLQLVVTRIEHQEFQVRGWLLVLLAALLAALYADKTRLEAAMFGGVSALLTFCLAFAELVVRVTKRKAINRSHIVEEFLSESGEYDGPKLALSLGSAWDWQTLSGLMWHEARIITVWGFYLPIWVIVLILSNAAR
jgi:hypothetical protein